MDKELQCDFYFGDKVPGVLKEMDCTLLKGYKKRFCNIVYDTHIIWQRRILYLLFKPYKHYILTVDTACLTDWIFIVLAKLLNKNIYFWTHGWYGNESSLEKIKKKFYYYPATALLLYSEYAKNLMIQEGFKNDKLFVIANSLDYFNHLKIRKELTKNNIYYDYFQNHDPVIIFIGRLEPKKRLNELIKMIDTLQTKNKNINVVMIGSGSDEIHLKSLADKLKLTSKIWFVEECYDEKTIGNYLYNADICLSPGNVGLTAIHALSFGTPVITHSDFQMQMPEFESIIENKTGAFFVRNDYASMVDCVDNWLTLHPVKDQQTIDACFSSIDLKYNPYYQLDVIKKALQL
ncbi:hypothetical protein FACS189474_1820 [Bacteroidia bacterium]|nr:hypothetical protein FACS189474_1820 [Bacteroidia bacterium]